MKNRGSKKDIYKEVTDKIIGMMEAGSIPWNNQWVKLGLPKNMASGKQYNGINIWVLIGVGADKGYDSSNWFTYRQCTKLGGQIRVGEKSTMVVFWKFIKVESLTEPEKSIPLLRYYNVFNITQADGIEIPDKGPLDFMPHERAEEIVQGMKNPPGIVWGGNKASYTYNSDLITLPGKERFTGIDAYYATLFHELIHSTRHSSRTARDTEPNTYGSDKYSFEELVAELGSAFLCCRCGISNEARVINTASYLQGWLTKFKSDPKMLIKAGGKAQRAVNYILNGLDGREAIISDS